jgi:hypothetical protein
LISSGCSKYPWFLKQNASVPNDNVLTTDRSALAEDISYFLVNVSNHIVCFLNLLVSLGDSLINPSYKRFANNCINYRCDIFTMQLKNFSMLWRKSFGNLRVSFCKLEHVFNGQTSVVWSLVYFNVLTFDANSASCCKVSQMINCHASDVIQEASALRLQEAVNLYLQKLNFLDKDYLPLVC